MNTEAELSSSTIAKGSSQQRNTRLILIAIVFVGLILRFGIAIHQGLSTPPRPGSDASEYDCYAWNLAQGHGYIGISPDVVGPDGKLLIHPTAYRVPGTSLYWSLLFRIFGHRYTPIRISTCLFETLIILLVYGIGRRCFGNTIALCAAAIYSIMPTAILWAGTLGSEAQYAFLFSSFVLLCLIFAERRTWSWAIAAGVVLGFAILTRGNGVMMTPLVLVWSVWQFRKTPRVMIRGIAIVFVAVAVILPWTIRNYAVFHALIPFETGEGDVALGCFNRVIANDPYWAGYWVYPTEALPEYTKLLTAPNDEVVRDRLQKQLAVQWILKNPGKLPSMELARFRRSFTPFLNKNDPKLFRVAMAVSWTPILIPFALGFFPTLVYFLKRSSPGWLLHLGVLHFMMTCQIFYGTSRFRYPTEGLCIILACATVAWCIQQGGNRLRSSRHQ
jgi:4-amino-4-deoxy-L-arabinose transferase-like glycosyltransferase